MREASRGCIPGPRGLHQPFDQVEHLTNNFRWALSTKLPTQRWRGWVQKMIRKWRGGVEVLVVPMVSIEFPGRSKCHGKGSGEEDSEMGRWLVSGFHWSVHFEGSSIFTLSSFDGQLKLARVPNILAFIYHFKSPDMKTEEMANKAE